MLPYPAMQDWRAIFGRNVRRFRQQRRLTQEELADALSVPLVKL
jgi:DNA-binding XRE family transcriptional regulator